MSVCVCLFMCLCVSGFASWLCVLIIKSSVGCNWWSLQSTPAFHPLISLSLSYNSFISSQAYLSDKASLNNCCKCFFMTTVISLVPPTRIAASLQGHRMVRRDLDHHVSVSNLIIKLVGPSPSRTRRYTGYHMNIEVKQFWAWIVIRWETAWELQV